MDKLYLIRFNDDNHDETVWVNGIYAGTITHPKDILEKTMTIISDEKLVPGNFEIEEVVVYVCDDFDESEEYVADEIWDWFNQTVSMSDDEMKAVINKDWSKLYDLISEEKE